MNFNLYPVTKISVVIPIYNEKDSLPELLDCSLAVYGKQTLRSEEMTGGTSMKEDLLPVLGSAYFATGRIGQK